MKITQEQNESTITLKLKGCLDSVATADFESAIMPAADKAAKLLIDFTDLEFISSPALRTLVMIKKKHPQKEIVLTGLNEVVRDVFEVTGLSEVFTII